MNGRKLDPTEIVSASVRQSEYDGYNLINYNKNNSQSHLFHAHIQHQSIHKI